MDKKKLLILGLVVVGVLIFMGLGAGAIRSKNDPDRQANDSTEPGVTTLDELTGWMRAELDPDRLRGCSRSGGLIAIAGNCEMIVIPGGGWRPSGFSLEPNVGLAMLCFGMSRKSLDDCVKGRSEPGLRPLTDKKKFTVAKDSAFFYFQCGVGSSNCGVLLK